MLRWIPMLTACALSQAAAQTVYKCSEQGKLSYGDQPCPDGHSVVLAVPSAPPSAAALEQLQRERTLLRQLEDQRARQELAEQRARQHAWRALAERRRRCDRLRLERKWADEDAASSAGTRAQAARLRARRRAEALAVECPT
jgi:hypothetical protein